MIAAVPYELGSVIAAAVHMETSEEKSRGLQEIVGVQGLT